MVEDFFGISIFLLARVKFKLFYDAFILKKRNQFIFKI